MKQDAVLASPSLRNSVADRHVELMTYLESSLCDCRARWRRGRQRAGAGGEGEGGEEAVAVLRQLRRVHEVDPAAVPVHGRGARRVPPGVPGLRQVRPQRPPARLPVHGPHPQLLPAALQRRRRPLT
jgi:hypothetical protein